MFPWEQSGENQRQQHISCSRSWSPSQREGLGTAGFSRSPSVDERTSPVLHKLLWLLIGALIPLRMYLKGIAVIEHTWEDQKKVAMENNTQPFYSQWRWTSRKNYRRIQIQGKSWNLAHAQQKPGPSILLRLITTVRRAWGRGYASVFFTFTRWFSRGFLKRSTLKFLFQTQRFQGEFCPFTCLQCFSSWTWINSNEQRDEVFCLPSWWCSVLPVWRGSLVQDLNTPSLQNPEKDAVYNIYGKKSQCVLYNNEQV